MDILVEIENTLQEIDSTSKLKKNSAEVSGPTEDVTFEELEEIFKTIATSYRRS